MPTDIQLIVVEVDARVGGYLLFQLTGDEEALNR